MAVFALLWYAFKPSDLRSLPHIYLVESPLSEITRAIMLAKKVTCLEHANKFIYELPYVPALEPSRESAIYLLSTYFATYLW